MAGDSLVVSAATIRRLRVAALAYMRRTGAADPELLEAIDEVWLGGSTRRAFVSVAEAARMLGLGQRTVERGIASGAIPSTRIGGRRLIPADFCQAPPPAANGGAPGSVAGEAATYGDTSRRGP